MVTVRASNSTDTTGQPTYTCDGTADDVQIQAALNGLTNGGVVALSDGTFTLAAKVTIPANCALIGTGRNATIITAAAAYTGTMVQLSNYARLEAVKLTVPTTTTADVISAIGPDYWAMRDMEISGGSTSQSDQYMVKIANQFNARMDHIRITSNSNGIAILNTDNAFNYGNSVFSLVEMRLNTAGRIGWDIQGANDGTAQTANQNIMLFDYCSCICGPLVETGSISCRLRNAQYTTWHTADFEGCETSLKIEGNISGGPHSQANTFIGGYMSRAINIDANSFNTVFVGGKVGGTITDSQATANKLTRYFGAIGSAGTQLG